MTKKLELTPAISADIETLLMNGTPLTTICQTKGSTSLSKVIEIIKMTGALKEVQKTCDSYIDNCLAKLLLFPDSDYKVMLQDIVKDIRKRKA